MQLRIESLNKDKKIKKNTVEQCYKVFYHNICFCTFRGPEDLPGNLVSPVSGYSSFPSKEVSKQIKVRNKWPFSDF